jgi:nucleoside-diphosphate-sugar epimerase
MSMQDLVGLNTDNGRVLILGARSWIGSRLIAEFQLKHPRVKIAGTSRAAVSVNDDGVDWFIADNTELLVQCMEKVNPSLIINLIWWPDFELTFEALKVSVNWALERRVGYCFASSALALEGYAGASLTEDLPARAISPYGQSKARCEAYIAERPNLAGLILRFGSIQGWSRWQLSRNERFLKKLRAGEGVSVMRGVLQNRMYDEHFARLVIRAIIRGVRGVINVGTVDGSEEYQFLKNVAKAFGYETDLVSVNGERQANLIVTPFKLIEIFGVSEIPTESETIAALRRCDHLNKYHNI